MATKEEVEKILSEVKSLIKQGRWTLIERKTNL